MIYVLMFTGAVLCCGLVLLLFKNKSLIRLLAERENEAAGLRLEMSRIRTETENSLDEAQKLIDQQVASMRSELKDVRDHYEKEARKIAEASQEELSKTHAEIETLSRFSQVRDAEKDARKMLETAMAEAGALQAQAKALIELARAASESERLRANERAKTVYEQADARLNQAVRDAGRIIAVAEEKAKSIAGEAYDALRDKHLLERAVEAMRNLIEGYGDRYLISTHSLLDDLAIEFGYTSAGESLKSARTQSRRMVEQGEAAVCDYVEASRRETATRFVIDAFNGRVDAILTRVKRDNYGQLEQEIRDAFSLVNLNGKAFRDSRIFDAYLEARLAELKWAVVVQEIARRQMEEQREVKARMRDEEKARKEYEAQMRQAAMEEEIKRKALEAKESEIAALKQALDHAAAQDKVQLEQKLAEMQKTNETLRQDLATATEKTLSIAQQTKKGHVYVISNIGAFGEGIYKIGQTRRLNRQERIDELGDASVPFDFDVHAWIESDNAPVLEHKIQKRFLARQMNKINSRKEFFRVTLKEIREELDRLSQADAFMLTHWTDVAPAAEYRETLDIQSDPEKLTKWLKRQTAITDREILEDSSSLPPVDVECEETLSAPLQG